MTLPFTKPIIYLITGGKTTPQTSNSSDEYRSVLKLAEAAVAAEIPLLQLREKQLSARVLYQLTCDTVELVRGSRTRVLVNDRADVAKAAAAHGVQLTAHSLKSSVVRKIYGDDFLIGVSTHSLDEAVAVRQSSDFVLFGPIFDTPAKREFGGPQGIQKLVHVCARLENFPVIAIGGVTVENAASCFSAGASGVAAISMLSDPTTLLSTYQKLQSEFQNL